MPNIGRGGGDIKKTLPRVRICRSKFRCRRGLSAVGRGMWLVEKDGPFAGRVIHFIIGAYEQPVMDGDAAVYPDRVRGRLPGGDARHPRAGGWAAGPPKVSPVTDRHPFVAAGRLLCGGGR